MTNYIILTKNNFYSVVSIVPLFILYQLLGFFINYNSPLITKNSADVYIEDFFYFFGTEYSNILYFIFFISIMIFIFFKNRNLFICSEIKLSFLFGMIFESAIHSMSLIIVMSLLSGFLPLSLTLFENIVLENVYLSIGAGIWEELLFRYIIISGLFFLLNKIIYDFSSYSYLIIIFLSSAIFSCYHFIDLSMEFISWSLFIYRFIAGVLLSVVFIFRGLGIAVYTHTFYDLYLVFLES